MLTLVNLKIGESDCFQILVKFEVNDKHNIYIKQGNQTLTSSFNFVL